MSEQLKELENIGESKVNASITGNSKGVNTHVSVYQGVTTQEIDDCIDKAIYAFNRLNDKAKNGEATNENKNA